MINPNEFADVVLTPENHKKFVALSQLGITFEVMTYTFKAKNADGKGGYQISTPIATQTMMKKKNDAQSEMANKMVNEFMGKLYNEVGKDQPAIDWKKKQEKVLDKYAGKKGQVIEAKKIPATTGVNLGQLLKKKMTDMEALDAMANGGVDFAELQEKKDEFVEIIEDDIPAPPKMKAGLAKPKTHVKIPGVVFLKEATKIGQKVYGSSAGSIYETVAVNARVKLACRINGSNLSMRAEVENATPQEMSAIKSLMKWQLTYGSMHLDIGKVPPRRVLGALIFGMGIKFDQCLNPGDALPGGA